MPRAGQLGGWLGRSVGDLSSLFQSAQDSTSSYDSQTPSSQEMSLMAFRASSLQDAQESDPCDTSWSDGTNSGVTSLPSAKYGHQASLDSLRPYSAPLLAISNPDDPDVSAELDSPGPQESQAQGSTLDQQSRLSKVTWENSISLNFSLPVSQSTHWQAPFRVGGFPEIP